MPRNRTEDRDAVGKLSTLKLSAYDRETLERAAAIESERAGARVGWSTILKTGGLAHARRVIARSERG